MPGTWDDPEKIAKCMDTLIPHANLGQGAAFAVFLGSRRSSAHSRSGTGRYKANVNRALKTAPLLTPD